MKRIFVALEISDEAKSEVAEYIVNLRKEFGQIRVGWVNKDKLHLTLKFLGDLDKLQLQDLEKAVQQTSEKISKFKLKIAETGVFPNVKKARVLWIDLNDENENLFKLNEILENECEKCGFEKAKRNFKPHLTIARIREPYRSETLIRTHIQNKFEPVEFEVSRIVIFESKLHPTSSLFSIYSSFELQDF